MLTVGVAPGTTTLQLGNCPPDPPWQYFTPPFKHYGMKRPAAAAGPTAIVQESFNPYATESKLDGLGAVAVDPLKTRWDIVAMVAGGALVTTVLLAALASR